jgi:O-6-methylguanine DNA methyltransferase
MASFRERVYEIVRDIPRGRVLTYQAVARLAGSPRAFRAVGNVLNGNPNPGKIPCHRVIRSDGELGGYKWGKSRKASLLRKEGVILNNWKINN